MDIREYLFIKNLKVDEFAKILDCAPSYLSSVKCKKRKPGKKFARQVEKATNGMVRASYLLYEIEYPPRKKY